MSEEVNPIEEEFNMALSRYQDGQDLIGGGFNFVNPNASQTCGCGSSFAV